MVKCNPGHVVWVKNVFGECIHTNLEKGSFAIGLISTLCWLISSWPQISHNCKTKRVANLSPSLFAIKLIANICSLVGLILNEALITQLVTTSVFIVMDLFLLSQYIYYRFCYRDRSDLTSSIDIGMTIEEGTNGGNPLLAASLLGIQAASSLDLGAPYKGKELLGTILGWASAAIYVISRIPQVVKNFKERQAGLNLFTVIFYILGNSTFGASIFLRSTKAEFLWAQTPWITGSIVPMILDLVMFFQYFCFGEAKPIFLDEQKTDRVKEFPKEPLLQ